ncbi:MAG TPA: copper resistance CopC family protein [Micromonosporaceae bacterium]|nr:copper resistance CopC family protein [Micromonosporaceae bacterium]
MYEPFTWTTSRGNEVISTVSPHRRSKLPLLFRLAVALAGALVVALLPAAPAAAHNQLSSATPAKDAVLPAPPDEVVLEFVERLNPKFTTIVVTDEGKKTVSTSAPQISGARGSITFTQPLEAGTYTVAYRVVSLDGHPVQGSYSFTVTAASTPTVGPTAAATAAPTVEPAGPGRTAAADESVDASGGVGGTAAVIGVVAVAALAAGGGALWWRRRGALR